jgi:Xaa-Pro aminopeptidase
LAQLKIAVAPTAACAMNCASTIDIPSGCHFSPSSRIAVLPALRQLRAAFPDAVWVDALFVLERQRAVKSADELAKLKIASESVLASMQAVIEGHGAGATKNDIVDALRLEEVKRGMTFEYCLITAGTSLNRAPSDQKLEPGDIMSIDSGGNYKGYIGDICRMAILGEPDAELTDYLGEIETIQRAAMKPSAGSLAWNSVDITKARNSATSARGSPRV